jgi:hypothetical protein
MRPSKLIMFAIVNIVMWPWLIGLWAPSVFADSDDILVKFKGGIGVIPISSVVVNEDSTITVNRNLVRGVNSPGQIWVIDKLDATVETNGNITVKGQGLILGGGNNVGRATGQHVFATLICEAEAPFVLRNTDTLGVLLAANGDFNIDDVLEPLPPETCVSPMLLIRTAGSGNWFAAGIPTEGDDD